VIKSYFYKLFKLFEYYDAMKENLVDNLVDKFHVTRDKIDLYKEYLDVLSKQFTVQDGRQLNQINSLEERTKVIIRRCLGNLIILFHLIYSKLNTIVPMVQSKFNFINRIVVSLYQVYQKHDGQITKLLVESFIDEFTKFSNGFQGCVNTCISYLNASPTVLWFVPHFDSFGILFEDYEYEDYEVTSKQSFVFYNNNSNHNNNNGTNNEEENNFFHVSPSLFALNSETKKNVLELALLFQ